MKPIGCGDTTVSANLPSGALRNHFGLGGDAAAYGNCRTGWRLLHEVLSLYEMCDTGVASGSSQLLAEGRLPLFEPDTGKVLLRGADPGRAAGPDEGDHAGGSAGETVRH